MARVTVEDCLGKVANRFELVLLASKRARDIAVEGADPQVPLENDKPTVLALREIADGFISPEYLNESKVKYGILPAVALKEAPKEVIDDDEDIPVI